MKHSSKIVNPHSLGNNGTNKDLLKCRRTKLGDWTCKGKVCTQGMREFCSDTKSTTNFAGDSQSGKNQEAECISGSELGKFTNQARLRSNPSITVLPDYRSIKLSNLEKID